MTKIGYTLSSGYLLAGSSVCLVSVAQLAMKYALMGLPSLWTLNFNQLENSGSWLLLASGVLCYLLSLVVWYFTLQHLPLGKACALLSLSYVVVWLGALILPFYPGTFSLRTCSGVAAIVVGVLLVCWPRRGVRD